MRSVLTVQAVEVAPVEEQRKVVVSGFRPWPASVFRVPRPCPGWTEPSSAAVRNLRIKIVIQSRLVWTRH